jgi:hypothetical protein
MDDTGHDIRLYRMGQAGRPGLEQVECRDCSGQGLLLHLFHSCLTSYSIVCAAVRIATRHPTQGDHSNKIG